MDIKDKPTAHTSLPSNLGHYSSIAHHRQVISSSHTGWLKNA
jgi:hypothetical protein